MDNSPKQIKAKMVGEMQYTLTHWPQNNTYVIHKHDISKDGSGRAHLSPEVATFYDEKEAIEYFEKI